MASTSVRVALRVRPLNSKETIQNCSECLTLIPDAPQILIGTDRSFTFDYVFPSDTEQEDVFQECALPLIDKLIEGYNVTILAYGQTGSGKTYSMGTGSNMSAEHQGIIPRAIRKLFNDLNERKEKNPSYQSEVLVSFLELYNEDLIDLLNPQSRENNKKGKNELMIREDVNGQIYWAGVKEVPVSSSDDLLEQLQKGSLCRAVASTDINMVSSRSHAIFSVILKQTKIESFEENKENDVPPAESSTASKRKSKQKSLTSKVISKFHFVDLAGSERLKRTNAVGDRAKEGIAINGGLLALGNVISALGDESQKATHIPYRDSKLTRLLQDSLGGNSQTLMLACVSPAEPDFMETLNTLKYANRTRNIKNKVSVNESYGDNSAEINQLRGQINRLKMEIQTLHDGGCSEETSRKYEEEIKTLKGELGMTKMKLHTVEQDLIKANTEKNTLLMEINFNDKDLSEADREHKMKTHNIVQSYETEIRNLKNQIADLQAAQADVTPGRHGKFSDPFIYSSDEDAHFKKGKKKKKRSSKKNKTRADGHFPISDGTSVIPPVGSSSSHQLEQIVNPSNLEEAKSLFSHYEDDINEDLDGDGEDQFNLAKKRSKTRDKLEKAKEQIKQSYLLIKNGGSLCDDPFLSQLVRKPSSTKSENYVDKMTPNRSQEMRLSNSMSFSEIPTFDYQESDPSPQPTRHSSKSGHSSDRPNSRCSINSTDCSSQQRQNALALTRMLHQIQADIYVKEQLVSQLERAEQEYTYMRTQYKQKLTDMQEALINLQRERDAAVKYSQNSGTGISTRDKDSILAELKARYEHKIKRTIQEISELRRKYNEATQSNTTMKNQNETVLKSMHAQIEQLKVEKMRMIKRMKNEAERVREMIQRNQREIHHLRRKEKAAQEQKKRLKKNSKMQKIMLEKKQKEVLQISGKLKSVMMLLKQTKTPKSITKAFRNHKRNQAGSSHDDDDDEIQTIDCQEYNPPTRNSSLYSDRSNSHCSINSTSSSQQHQNVLAFIHQTHADVAVKKQLISQLERAEQEYTYIRTQYKQKLTDMQEALINLQRERDAAVKRAQDSGTGISARDKNIILAEFKARYEHKMKRLIQEIGELRHKYTEATQSNTTSKNQNETILKRMHAQIEQLKAEKIRMIKRTKDEVERVREMTERNQCEIQNLRRKEKAAQEQKKRLERTSEIQKLMLEKRQKEILQIHGKLKPVVTLLKRTMTPKEVLQINGKLKSVMTLLKRTMTPKSTFRNHKRNQVAPEVEDGKELRCTSGNFYDKKKLLDEVICKYISGHHQILTMMNKCKKLQEEKKELLEERGRITTGELGELDGEVQALDDKIEMITSEITCINDKIQVLKSEVVRNDASEQEKSNHDGKNSKDTDGKPRKNIKAGKKPSLILPENATSETSYDVAVSILRNLDSVEVQTILESLFKDIVDLRTGDLSRQMTLDQQEKTILELRKTLLAIRKGTVEYEKNRELEKASQRGGRSPSPTTPELQMDDIENDVSASTFATPDQNESRHNSYFFDGDLSSSVTASSPNQIHAEVPSHNRLTNMVDHLSG